MWGRQPKALACLKVKLGVCLYIYIYECEYVHEYVDRHACGNAMQMYFKSLVYEQREEGKGWGVPAEALSHSRDRGLWVRVRGPGLVPCPVVPSAQLPLVTGIEIPSGLSIRCQCTPSHASP